PDAAPSPHRGGGGAESAAAPQQRRPLGREGGAGRPVDFARRPAPPHFSGFPGNLLIFRIKGGKVFQCRDSINPPGRIASRSGPPNGQNGRSPANGAGRATREIRTAPRASRPALPRSLRMPNSSNSPAGRK